MSAEENKSLVRREQEELWNHSGDLDAADELFAAGEAAKQQARGTEDLAAAIEEIASLAETMQSRDG